MRQARERTRQLDDDRRLDGNRPGRRGLRMVPAILATVVGLVTGCAEPTGPNLLENVLGTYRLETLGNDTVPIDVSSRVVENGILITQLVEWSIHLESNMTFASEKTYRVSTYAMNGQLLEAGESTHPPARGSWTYNPPEVALRHAEGGTPLSGTLWDGVLVLAGDRADWVFRSAPR